MAATASSSAAADGRSPRPRSICSTSRYTLASKVTSSPRWVTRRIDVIGVAGHPAVAADRDRGEGHVDVDGREPERIGDSQHGLGRLARALAAGQQHLADADAQVDHLLHVPVVGYLGPDRVQELDGLRAGREQLAGRPAHRGPQSSAESRGDHARQRRWPGAAPLQHRSDRAIRVSETPLSSQRQPCHARRDHAGGIFT